LIGLCHQTKGRTESGIAVLWISDHMHVSILATDERAIHVLVHDISLGKSSMLSGIYGLAQKNNKKIFWDKLFDMCPVVDLTWCILGDFNELLTPQDEQGGLAPKNDRFYFLTQLLTVL